VSLVVLSTVAVLSYVHQATAMPAAASLALDHTVWASDVAVKPSYYVFGLTPRTAADGCVLLSRDDLYADYAEKHGSPTQTICISSSGPSNGRVDINAKQLAELGLIGADGVSLLSGINPGKNVNVVVYDGPNFDGNSVVVDAGVVDGALPQKLYMTGATTNDNVYSLSIISQNSFFFAGPNAGLDTQILAGIINSADAVLPQPAGCVLFTNTDPTEPKAQTGHTQAARFCTTKQANPFNSGVLVVTKAALQAVGLVNYPTYRHGKSKISFINRQGETTTLDFYTSDDAEGTHHSHTGTLGLWNDEINSFRLSSKASSIPADSGPFGV